MKLLLDTHVVLWWLADDKQLSDEARSAIADPDNTVTVSAASLFEIVIKKNLGKLEIADEWYEAISSEPFVRLPITWEHARKVGELPPIHRDPFDRLLIAQAANEDLILVTHDDIIARYGISILRT
jgi:PIN domain nuclease of toxin-antitoxin system